MRVLCCGIKENTYFPPRMPAPKPIPAWETRPFEGTTTGLMLFENSEFYVRMVRKAEAAHTPGRCAHRVPH